MSKTMVRNISGGAITLPPPYTGIIPPGVAVIIDDVSSAVAAALYIVPETSNLLTVSDVSDANPTTIPVSRQVAADTIATTTFAALTSPIDFNGQRGISAADPVAAQDVVTLAYFNAHSSGGGGVDYADLGEVDAPGGPYPGIPAGSPVAVVGGLVVLANASSATNAPCVGIYTGATTNRIRTTGLVDGLPALPSNAPVFLALGGGFTATVPTGAGHVSQVLGKSVSTSEVFLSIEPPIYL